MKTIDVIASGIAAVAVSGIAAGAAHAQTMTAPVSKPFTLKLGVYLPTDSDETKFSGNTHFDLGVAYEFGKTKTASPLVYGVYADYIFESSKTIGTYSSTDYADEESRQEEITGTEKGKSSGYDIGAQGRYFFTPDPLATVKPYAGAGIGFYSSTAKASVSYSDGTGYSASKTDSGFGGKLMLGAEFKAGYLAEVSYNFFPGDTKFSGVGLNVGYRF